MAAECERYPVLNCVSVCNKTRGGRFILSLNDIPEVRQIFAAFALTEVRTTYTVSSKRNDQTGDRAKLLISNRPF